MKTSSGFEYVFRAATPSLILRAKAAAVLLVLFPIITLFMIFVLRPIPFVGGFIVPAAYFSSPFMWFAVYAKIPSAPSWQQEIALWLHYPIAGLVIGFLLPFEFSWTSSCAKKVSMRYGLFFLAVMTIGIVLALYVLAHDS